MEQRVRAAMQRISELENMVQRDPTARSPMRSSLGPGGGSGNVFGSGGQATQGSAGQRSPMLMDDVRSGVKDKGLRRSLRQSPRQSLSRMVSIPDA
jgi:hypothetical protein